MDTSFLLPNPSRQPLIIDRGEGCWVFDESGRAYLDFVSGIGVNALGHNHPRIASVVAAQAARCIHTSGLYSHPYQAKLARELCRTARLDRALFTNSGAEAMEAALKLACCYGEARNRHKRHVVALRGSFHGRTRGALAVNGQAAFHDPFAPYGLDVTFVDRDDVSGLTAAVDNRTAAVVVEAIQGEGGVYPLTREFLQSVRKVTCRHDALLVVDECQAGLGRTGTHFAYEWAGIQPDVVTVAKPLAAGLPLGAVMFSEAVCESFPEGRHGSTFAGGPLACRLAFEFLAVLEEILPHIRFVADALWKGLQELQLRHSCILEIRGRGLMIGIELDRVGHPFVRAALERGLLINCTQENVLRLLPPFVLSKKEAQDGLRILDEILDGTDESGRTYFTQSGLTFSEQLPGPPMLVPEY